MDKNTKVILGCIAAAVIVPILGIAVLTVIGLTILGRRVPVENTVVQPVPTETR